MAENILYRRTESDDEEFHSSTDYSDTETLEEEMYLKIEELCVNEREKRMARCESCVGDECPWSDGSWLDDVSRSERGRQLYGRVAIFLCFLCKIYVCAECMSEHEGHDGMNVRRKESERQEREEMGGQSESEKNKEKGLGKETKRMRLNAESERKKEKEENESDRMREQRERKRRDYIDMVLNESERRRTEIFNNSHAIVYDRVEVKHELDQDEELDQMDCIITGMCGLENKRWVACDCRNSCIKIYKVGSHVLQRYIRFVGFGPAPWGVTEIHLKQNSAEPNLASGSSSDISAADRADQDKQCLIAVTLPYKHQIMFIDISKKPAKLQKVLKTERPCRSIQFNDDKIFTVCGEGPDSRCYVYIKSTDGVTLNMFDTGISDYLPGPYLAVVSGRVYLTDWNNNKVQCRNVEGQVISEFTIEGSGPTGISVDPDNNVYVCARGHNKVYKLDSDLTRHKSVLDQTAGYIESPRALCCYRNKLFISHAWWSSLRNFVTVVRLL